MGVLEPQPLPGSCPEQFLATTSGKQLDENGLATLARLRNLRFGNLSSQPCAPDGPAEIAALPRDYEFPGLPREPICENTTCFYTMTVVRRRRLAWIDVD